MTEKRPVYFASLCDLVGKMVVQCFDVNGKKPRWLEIRLTFYLLSTQERNMTVYERQDYKHDFTLENCSVVRQPYKAASRLSAIHLFLLKEYRCTDCKHSVCTRFFFWAKKHCTLYRCSTPMPTSPNDMENVNRNGIRLLEHLLPIRNYL